jgi:hypothetical protein
MLYPLLPNLRERVTCALHRGSSASGLVSKVQGAKLMRVVVKVEDDLEVL